jgi:hypothetical protein
MCDTEIKQEGPLLSKAPLHASTYDSSLTASHVQSRDLFNQIERVETLGEPVVDRGEKIASNLIPLTLLI